MIKNWGTTFQCQGKTETVKLYHTINLWISVSLAIVWIDKNVQNGWSGTYIQLQNDQQLQQPIFCSVSVSPIRRSHKWSTVQWQYANISFHMFTIAPVTFMFKSLALVPVVLRNERYCMTSSVSNTDIRLRLWLSARYEWNWLVKQRYTKQAPSTLVLLFLK